MPRPIAPGHLSSGGDQLQQLVGRGHRAGFFVIEELDSVLEQLELSSSTVSDFDFNAFLGSFFAQTPGRAS